MVLAAIWVVSVSSNRTCLASARSEQFGRSFGRIRISGRYVGLIGFPLGALSKRTDALIKRTDALMKRNDALIKRTDALIKRNDALIKRSNVTAAGAGAAKRSATILR